MSLCYVLCWYVCFCFLQAEDGIRDYKVTGVQTCALPIYQVYRSVDEVPAGLRTRLLKSTNGVNSATILIADRRGRKEIAKAMRHMPGPVQRRWMQTLMATEAAATAIQWITPARRRTI